MKKFSIVILISILFACESDGPSGPEPPGSETFDRTAMLNNWADNIILPGLNSFSTKSEALKIAGQAFHDEATPTSLENLRTAWREAYISWQRVSMFDIGKASELRYRDQLNIYPTNVIEIEENIEVGNYNLSLPSQNDRQGFPALDYLLHGLANTDSDILEFYTTHASATNYKNYVRDLVTRIDELTKQVLADWTDGGYRNIFVDNSGNSSNASVDMLVNDYMFYYEKNLRAGKVGIPAGVFSGNPLPTHVEAYYQKEFSKVLLQEALNAAQDFFNGKHFNSGSQGPSLKSYLDFLQSMKDGEDLSALINNQFESARVEISKLNDNFSQQIESDNISMLSAYDQLQLNVVLLKVDMLQALNINVDYVDADGD